MLDPLFDLIGGPRQLTLYALLAPIPIVVAVFAAEFVAAQRRSSNGGGTQRLLSLVDGSAPRSARPSAGASSS